MTDDFNDVRMTLECVCENDCTVFTHDDMSCAVGDNFALFAPRYLKIEVIILSSMAAMIIKQHRLTLLGIQREQARQGVVSYVAGFVSCHCF